MKSFIITVAVLLTTMIFPMPFAKADVPWEFTTGDRATWQTCKIRVDMSGLERVDKRANKFALRKISKVTGVKFKLRQHGEHISIVKSDMPELSTVWLGVADSYSNGLGLLDYVTVSYGPLWDTAPKKSKKMIALHELQHSLGIGHSDDPADIIFPSIGDVRTKFSKADRVALRGVTQGCR